MKNNSKEKQRKAVNLLKEDFDVIKEYCEANALKPFQWLGKIAKEVIETANKKGQ